MNQFQARINLQTPPAVLNLIVINVLFFMATALVPNADVWLVNNLGLHFWASPLFKIWQPITYMFLHGNLVHFFFNMFALWMFGRIAEYDLGTKRFLIYYFATGVGAGVLQLLASWIEISHLQSLVMDGKYPVENLFAIINGATVGASGAVFGVLLSFGMMHPNDRIMLLIPPVPIKAKYFVVGYGLIELFYGIARTSDGVAHFAHVGGMIFGFLLLHLWKKQRKIYY